MPFTTVLPPADLEPHLGDIRWALVDCRFSLNDVGRGRRDYLAGHIPGAVYAHLDDDLSGPIRLGETGRHPLPEVDRFTRTLSGWGIDEETQVVAYDDAGGAIAARLWWMLRWLGHEAVAVLDGGWPRWIREGRPTRSGTEERPRRSFEPHLRPDAIADMAAVDTLRQDPSSLLLDARASARYRGEVEPIDPVAGHIPGARSAPHEQNLDSDGCFFPAERLRAHYDALRRGIPPGRIIAYCGSGVTAAHDILAMEHAGLAGAKLYPGSWSEWITDAERPVATGEEE